MTREKMIAKVDATMMAINSVQVDLFPLRDDEDPKTSRLASTAWNELNAGWTSLYDLREHIKAAAPVPESDAPEVKS